MPKVILLRGKAGVGKTTTSNEISKHLNISIIRKDDIYDGISKFENNHQTRNQICEVIMKNILKTNLENNCDVIVDSSYHYIDQFQDFKKWIELHNGELKSILITCSNEEIWKHRFNKRKLNPNSNNNLFHYNVFMHTGS